MEKRQAAIHQAKKEKSPRNSKGVKTVRRPPRAMDSWATDARAPVWAAGAVAAPVKESIWWVQGSSSEGWSNQEWPPGRRDTQETQGFVSLKDTAGVHFI